MEALCIAIHLTRISNRVVTRRMTVASIATNNRLHFYETIARFAESSYISIYRERYGKDGRGVFFNDN